MNYVEIKRLLTTDDKSVAAQTLQEIHSTVLKAPTKRGAALRAQAKLKELSETKAIDYNKNRLKKNEFSTKAAGAKENDSSLAKQIKLISNENLRENRQKDDCLLSSSSDEDSEMSAEEEDQHLERVLSAEDNKGWLVSEMEDEDNEWSEVMRRHEIDVLSIPDWRQYVVPPLDLPDSEKDFHERICKEQELSCSLCKIPKKDCLCLGRDVLGIFKKKNIKF